MSYSKMRVSVHAPVSVDPNGKSILIENLSIGDYVYDIFSHREVRIRDICISVFDLNKLASKNPNLLTTIRDKTGNNPNFYLYSDDETSDLMRKVQTDEEYSEVSKISFNSPHYAVFYNLIFSRGVMCKIGPFYCILGKHFTREKFPEMRKTSIISNNRQLLKRSTNSWPEVRHGRFI